VEVGEAGVGVALLDDMLESNVLLFPEPEETNIFNMESKGGNEPTHAT